MDCSLPVPRSLAVTCTMPLEPMSKVTSIWGMPRGAGAMPVSSKVPSILVSREDWRSPWKSWLATEGWLSSAVGDTSGGWVGMAALRSMGLVSARAGRRGGDAGQLAGAEHRVVAGALALALEALDRHGGLVVLGGGEHLGGLGGDGRVALDELGHHSALGLDAQRQRSDVHQQHV